MASFGATREDLLRYKTLILSGTMAAPPATDYFVVDGDLYYWSAGNWVQKTDVNNEVGGKVPMLVTPDQATAFQSLVSRDGKGAVTEVAGAAFRAAGGLVGCYYYPEWESKGQSYRGSPWSYFKGYSERHPIASVGLPIDHKYTFSDQRLQGWGPVTGQSTIALPGWVDSNANWTLWTGSSCDIAASGSILTVTGNAFGDPAIRSSNTTLMNYSGAEYTRVRMVIKRLGTSNPPWLGRLQFWTTADGTWEAVTKVITAPEPAWDADGTAEVTFDILSQTQASDAARAAWQGTTITRFLVALWDGPNSSYQHIGIPQVERAGGNFVQLGSLGTTPYLQSPDNLSLVAGDVATIQIDIRRTAGSGWAGQVEFSTVEGTAFGASTRFTVTEPTWDGTVKTITISNATLLANSIWTAQTIKRIRMLFGNTITDAFEIHGVRFNLTALGQREASLVYGLPSDDPIAVDWELKTAYDNGIDFFAVENYWGKVRLGNTNSLRFERTLELVAKSAAAPAMRYCIMDVNNSSDGNPFASLAELQAWWDFQFSYFTKSRYLKRNGRPVIMINDLLLYGNWWRTALGGAGANDRDAAQNFVTAFRAYIAAKAHPTVTDVYIVAINQYLEHPALTGRAFGYVGSYEYAGANAATVYNKLQAQQGQVQNGSGGTVSSKLWPETLRSYEQLREVYTRAVTWIRGSSGTQLPLWYPAIAGNDRRPWMGLRGLQNRTSSNCNPQPSEWAQHLREQRTLALTYSNLEVAGPVVMIYAWNEYGEGGWICPDKGRGYAMAQAVREVFGPAAVWS